MTDLDAEIETKTKYIEFLYHISETDEMRNLDNLPDAFSTHNKEEAIEWMKEEHPELYQIPKSDEPILLEQYRNAISFNGNLSKTRFISFIIENTGFNEGEVQSLLSHTKPDDYKVPQALLSYYAVKSQGREIDDLIGYCDYVITDKSIRKEVHNPVNLSENEIEKRVNHLESKRNNQEGDYTYVLDVLDVEDNIIGIRIVKGSPTITQDIRQSTMGPEVCRASDHRIETNYIFLNQSENIISIKKRSKAMNIVEEVEKEVFGLQDDDLEKQEENVKEIFEEEITPEFDGTLESLRQVEDRVNSLIESSEMEASITSIQLPDLEISRSGRGLLRLLEDYKDFENAVSNRDINGIGMKIDRHYVQVTKDEVEIRFSSSSNSESLKEALL